MSDIWAIVIGAVVGVLLAPVCALLIVAWLRSRQAKSECVPWSVIFARPALPELPARSSPLALPCITESRQ